MRPGDLDKQVVNPIVWGRGLHGVLKLCHTHFHQSYLDSLCRQVYQSVLLRVSFHAN